MSFRPSVCRKCCHETRTRQFVVDSLWSMSGRLFDAKSMDNFAGSGLHEALFHGYRLRLAVFYCAPIEMLQLIASAVEPHEANILGMSFGNEWVFLRNIVGILQGDDTRPGLAIFEGCTNCKSSSLRALIADIKLPIMSRVSTS